ncbi:hypothetical protein [Ferriphaselus amnicola]|uniref:hypothetical protein n=1 Tax=Ferriphaselus amnicola TaxID=1188319 RepID=UPI0007883AA1|nr:hypothetical protein [Ferriphaselus amnicola]
MSKTITKGCYVIALMFGGYYLLRVLMLTMLFLLLWIDGSSNSLTLMFELFRSPLVWNSGQEAMLSLLDEVNLYLLPLQAVAGFFTVRRWTRGLGGKGWHPVRLSSSWLLPVMSLTMLAMTVWASFLLLPPSEIVRRALWVWLIVDTMLGALPAFALIASELREIQGLCRLRGQQFSSTV